jgi:DHA2 family multidrug resistance protein
LPQYVQIWLGWSAQDAGLALSPGACVVIVMLPLVGRLITKFDARWLIAFGFAILSFSLYHMARTIYPGIAFSTAVWLRIYQSCGMAFLFVPINTAMYAGVPPSKNNQVSGIVNLARNMGGSIGIAFVATTIARRAQLHQANLSAHLTPGHEFMQRVQALSMALQHAGVGAARATKMATGVIYGQLIKQSQTLAYLDVLFLLALFSAIMVPLVLLTKKPKPGAAMAH